MINFLVEISKSSESNVLPTPTIRFKKHYNIYELNINTPPSQSYWTNWGGWYDNFVGSNIKLYYTEFLVTRTEAETMTTPFSMFIDNGIVYFNVPMHTWLYPDYTAESREVIPILSSALNPDNPSNNIINDTPALVRLEIPSTSVRLSDSFNGVDLKHGFSVNLINNDGYFDDESYWKLFNTPISLKKSTKNNPEYNDFIHIGRGLIDNTVTTFDKFRITASDIFASMNEPVCNVVSNTIFPHISIEDSALGRSIPIVYGTKTIRLLQLNATNYLTAEGAASIIYVMDNDDNIISNSQFIFNVDTGLITVVDDTVRPITAQIKGFSNNRIGEIIQHLIETKTSIPEGISDWNVTERDDYTANSPRINIEINSGDVRRAISNILRSDMAYFIQQLDSKFTIRKYGNNYKAHIIDTHFLTKKPEKNYASAHDNYFSSCIINYDFDDGEHKSFIFTDKEHVSESRYKKRVQRTFETNLTSEIDARAFAALLSNRYSLLKQTIKIAIGKDTSDMNLLDTIIIDIDINDRKFSKATKFIIKEINSSQDSLTLEEI